jgi:hypothetical protein
MVRLTEAIVTAPCDIRRCGRLIGQREIHQGERRWAGCFSIALAVLPRTAFFATSCLICGRKPADPHHLRFVQQRALGRKVSDEFTVPLCRGHHREVHRSGAWWTNAGVDPTVAARALWLETHPLPASADQMGSGAAPSTNTVGADQQKAKRVGASPNQA